MKQPFSIAPVISVILVLTTCAISYKIIHTFCHLVSVTESDKVNVEILEKQMQALKDWGGIVLGFFFGAAFNFVIVALKEGSKSGQPPDDPGEITEKKPSAADTTSTEEI